MFLRPFSIFEPTGAPSPIVVDSPHSGRIYPVDFNFVCPLPLLRQIEDAYMDEVILGATEAGASVIVAEFPRSMIDVNRAENDIDPSVVDGIWPDRLVPQEATLSGFGLIRRLVQSGVPVYPRPLLVAEVRKLIENYYRPYHDCLRQLIEQKTKQFGYCLFIDAHSMPDRVDNGVPRADFILGDRDGTSCDPAFTRDVHNILQAMGYSVAVNAPYKGREIIRRYGLLGQGAQALQLEINRKLYMDENAVVKHQGFDKLQKNMTQLFMKLADFHRISVQDKLAAE